MSVFNDINQLNYNGHKIDPTTGTLKGSQDAHQIIVEYHNVACPDCKNWWETHRPYLTRLTRHGDLGRLIKFLNKDKPGLRAGRVAHKYLDLYDPNHLSEQLDFLYANQAEWRALGGKKLTDYLEEHLGQAYDHQDILDKVAEEAERLGLHNIPTIVLSDDDYWTEDVTTPQVQCRLFEMRK
ncbi:hypothetical protein D3H64_00725 [Atopobacter sp. AH10]|uniref:thioredoxin domain-containing protein n=1 Tax=Atopobacter sp. AH10 TaxID=2315861 RepID=UPI000EF27022|nr:thioredoxin domain-containing protein [Atopobacter sp. AH10]RLK64086.1 hypothetical protein D3H64_00725 [Atopobacter sp. AH10]